MEWLESCKSECIANFWGTYSCQFVFTFKDFATNLLRSQKEISFLIQFCWRCLICGVNRGFMSNKLTPNLLNYGDFIHSIYFSDSDRICLLLGNPIVEGGDKILNIIYAGCNVSTLSFEIICMKLDTNT